MKRAIVILLVLGVMVFPISAEAGYGRKVIKFKVSGAATNLGDPFAGDFGVVPALAGSGGLGAVTAQGLFRYDMLNLGGGATICDLGQIAFRMEAQGDILLAIVTPGATGVLTPAGVDGYTWTQTIKGTLGGGTGRFARAAGTFTMTLTGSLVAPSLVSLWVGKVEVVLEPK